jgi:hypothetical protein
MALDGPSGYIASNGLQNLNGASLPIFNVERVQLQFSIASDFVAAQVADNVLVLALSNGRILRIDLDHPEDIDGNKERSLSYSTTMMLMFIARQISIFPRRSQR